MSIVLELRGRTSHAGVTLVHPTSEHIVLGTVFGIVKNLSFDAARIPGWRASRGMTASPRTTGDSVFGRSSRSRSGFTKVRQKSISS